MDENSTIFRQKSIDRVSSPEQLDKYIKTTKPSLWILFAAITVFLAGIIVWASVGKLETASSCGSYVSNGTAATLISEADYEKVTEEAFVRIDEEESTVLAVYGPYEADTSIDSQLLHFSGLASGDWYYVLYTYSTLSDGIYSGKVIFDRISPISFILN